MSSSSLSPCDHETLHERALAGDAHVLDALFRCMGDDLRAYLTQRCRTPADADDALQDAFAAAFAHIGDFRAEGSLYGWLRRIAQNACTRRFRTKKNNPAVHTGLVDAHLSYDGAARVESLLETRLGGFAQALQDLSTLDRRVLLLRDGQELSTAETAEVVGLTAQAVRSRLTRARRRVRERLGGPEG